MATLPAAGYISNAARSEGEAKVALDDLIASIKQIPGAGIAETTLTIASGSITPPSGGPGIFSVDTEASAANDALTNIVQTNLPDGSIIWIRPANAARTITVTSGAGGAGQIILTADSVCTLGNTTHWMALKRTGTTWVEQLRTPRLAVRGIISQDANYTVTLADRGAMLDCWANSFTVTLPAAALCGVGFDLWVRNSGSGLITIDGNAAELINAASTVPLYPTGLIYLVSNGGAWIIASTGTANLTNLGQTALPRMAISGLTYARSSGDATNDIDVAAGECRDAGNTHNIVLSAITKQLDVAWSVGSAAGMLDTGAVGNNDYYIWAIKRPDTGVCDVLASLSSTAPTMPANYTVKRLIGWIKRVGGVNMAFTTYETGGGGIEFLWSAPTLDINLANTLTTSRRTDALKVPLGFSTLATINVVLDDAGVTSAWICCPDQTDAAPSITAAPLTNVNVSPASADRGTQLTIRTSATGTIAARSDAATMDLYAVSTMGFSWARRN